MFWIWNRCVAKYSVVLFRCTKVFANLKVLTWAGSLNQGAATTIVSGELILKGAHLIAIFKRKKWWVGNTWENIHRLGGCWSFTAANEPLLFLAHHCHFLLKIHVLLSALAVAVAALIDLKLQLISLRQILCCALKTHTLYMF